MTKDFSTLMGEAAPAEKTVEICLRGDLVADLEQLESRFEVARQRGRTGLSKEDVDPTVEILEQIEALQEQMRESTYTFRLRKLPPGVYRTLRGQHPPRQDGEGNWDRADLQLGFNRDTFFPVLIARSTTDPVLSDAQWHELLGDSDTEAAKAREEGREPVPGLINYGQLLELSQAAYDVNETAPAVPFSLAALRARLATADE